MLQQRQNPLAKALILLQTGIDPDSQELEEKQSDHKTVWEPQRGPQTKLIKSAVEDVFFGGARGGGKTDGLLGDWIQHANRYGPAAKGVFFRQSYPELEEVQDRANAIFTVEGARYQAGAGKVAGSKTWIWPNGATLRMRYLQREKDARKYQGHSYSWIAFDELTHWANPQPIDKLWACLRSPIAGVRKSFRTSGNPGGPGHNWVKLRYIDPSPPSKPFEARIGSGGGSVMRMYIPARLEDNRILMLNDPEYWRRVEMAAGGNKALVQAWRHGDWDIVAGGMFDDIWHEAREYVVIEPFEIPKTWRIDRSFDWGSSHPFSVGWWAESDGTQAPNGRVYLRGTLFRIREWYGAKQSAEKGIVGLRMIAKDIAKGILSREEQWSLKGRVRSGPADSQIFDATSGVSTVSIADQMEEAGVEWDRADKRPGSRKFGAELLRARLTASIPKKDGSPSEEPGLYVFNGCRDFIRTIPVLPRDEKDQDDVDTNAEDHCYDEVRYKLSHVSREVEFLEIKGY